MSNELTHHEATINGINIHFVQQGEGPPIVLCHGFPHTWYSWHRQIPALAAAGYRVIALDMRGMGSTDAPVDADAYGVPQITGDLCGLLDYLGIEQAVFAGLDFGAFAIYDLAMLHPERVTAVIGLENPAAPHTPGTPPLTEYAAIAKNNFLHIEYFREPGIAEADLNANTREFLHKVYYALSGAFDFGEVLAQPPGISYRQALPTPPPLPWPWLDDHDLDIFTAAYTKSGFTGGLNWYRSMDIKWAQRTPLENCSSDVPAYFIGSANDVDLEHFHGDSPIDKMRKQFPRLQRVEMIADAGHMVQLEAAEQVNDLMIDYLGEITANTRPRSAVTN